MTSAQIRQSFLDFFREKQHTIVPSSSLMPDSPNLLFTNAGMNQFVPIFLGQKPADVSKWAGAIPNSDTRAADTQKCIRAGGKHNDLEDVGLDTYHHTFFEMLGNWSFGDYFKKEAIEWAWELVVGRWKFPPQRLYATVYCPHMDPEVWQQEMRFVQNTVENGEIIDSNKYLHVFHNAVIQGRVPFGGIVKWEPSDTEAAQFWYKYFKAAGLDPLVHIVPGNKKDNFWMMGETGPCGPCSELHVNLLPEIDEVRDRELVNAGDARCIEIWNLVFIQFNANPDGTLSPLPAKHVDTGMGFERVTSIIQGTKEFSDFANAKISNYETDVFRPIFDELEKFSGKRYGSTLPLPNAQGQVIPTTEQEKVDVAFRVIADHIRTLSFAVADGIQPGNSDRNYVLRRILRRAVRYGRTLGFREPFFYKLVDVLARTMGDVFPEIRTRQQFVQDVLRREEEAFNKTLDKGSESLALYMMDVVNEAERQPSQRDVGLDVTSGTLEMTQRRLSQRIDQLNIAGRQVREVIIENNNAALFDELFVSRPKLSGKAVFTLYDTFGFPLDLTELIARERGFLVDVAGFEKLMEEQRERARKAQKKQIIELSQIETQTPTRFVGYDSLTNDATVQEVVTLKDKTAVVLDSSTAYAEMGGQVGDTGEIVGGGQIWNVLNTQKSGNTWLHFIEPVEGDEAPATGSQVTFSVDRPRRRAIERHHSVTHLLHWALHEVVSKEATQKGSFVGPDKLTFDFNSQALTPQQVRDIEKLVNERILENAAVSWTEIPFSEVKGRNDIMQFFGDKYGDVVRVVQIGGQPKALNGYSMELCAGTHVRGTGEIGLFRIVGESAIAAGVRRIEAVAGLNAYDFATNDTERLKQLAAKINSPLGELEKKLDAMLGQQKELEKQLESLRKKQASATAATLVGLAQDLNGTPAIVQNVPGASGDELQTIADALKGAPFKGVVVLAGTAGDQVSLLAAVSPEFTSKFQAGKIIQAIAPVVGGKGGGRPDNARGAGKDASKVDAALTQAKSLLA
ncbi:alanine--tRNA ligase [Verrucomicrobiota bacterium sgz303538]